MRTWLLVDENDSTLASCETYRMPSLLQSTDGTLSNGVVEAFASVYVEEPLRGHGYASEMLRGVVNHTLFEGMHAYILYSEVGEKIYNRAGFHARPAFEHVLPALPPSDLLARADTLTRPALEALWRESPPPPPPPPPPGGPALLIRPSFDQLAWHLRRQDFYARTLGRPVPELCGARAPAGGGGGGGGLAFWCANYREGALVVHHLRAAAAADLAVLLAVAREYAGALGLDRVVAWEEEDAACGPDAWAAAASPDGRRRPRDDCIPMIRPAVPGLDPAGWAVISHSMWV
jgi:hypothetical protein